MTVQEPVPTDQAHREQPTSPSHGSGWQASLHMQLECSMTGHGAKTVMTGLHHYGPLRVQRPFYPEGDTAHIYLLHPPGGVVGGDGLDIDITARRQAHGLFTTPGATKFYLSAGDTARVRQALSVEAGGTLEWFPQENIFFPGAKVHMDTTIDLSGNARFMGWEISCLGRPVNSEIFEQGNIDARFRISRDGKPVMIERLKVDQSRHLNATSGLRNFPMQALFVATGCNEPLLEQARELIEGKAGDMPCGLTLIDDILVMRVLGTRCEKIQALMIPVWQKLRQTLLNKPAGIPRIWNT
ncbi:MAG: urease accessory protein UreD [Pseudomonadota bacterium]|uniref:urease accessory protein UreD n=1 Tax=Alcanivorax sp. TaxID=1872427 RepID=UPI0025C058F4|nr:urease accessory protein UreD [Alcanivorax sp.]MED5240177.1 urease accessory protein UreD [Pseudomonadota bacterium]MEE3321331.1 urease accessory protein UreD [Pseudomonadota bacterium]